MIKRFGLGLLVILLATLFPMQLINVQATSDPDQTVSSEPSGAADEDKFAIDDANSADYQKRLEERLKARREALKQRVTTAQQALIKQRCEAAQTKLLEISKKAETAKTTRSEIYNNIITRLNSVQATLTEKGYDVSKLEVSITELQKLVGSFNTDLQSLRQAAIDVTEMNCKDSPVGFKASLDELRAAREKLGVDSEAIRAYIKDSLKPVLEELRNTSGNKETDMQNGQDGTGGSN